MASRLEEDLSCLVCCDVVTDPVVLSCNHSFCKDCVQQHWAARQTAECPLCKRKSSKDIFHVNFALKTECEEGGSEPLCCLHSEKLTFFCADDQQLVCSVCRDAETHSSHKFTPVDEAARHLKKKLQDSLKPLRQKLRLVHQVKGNCDETAEHIKVQTESTVRRMKEEFKRLHRFLEEEEEARLAALREEEEQKSQMMKVKIEALSRETAALSDTIRASEKQLRAEDVSFMQNHQAALQRVQQQPLPDDPQLLSGALIDVAKHLGNLSFNIWSNMKEMVSYSPVILDPNSAHADLLLSDDLTGVRRGEQQQQLPDNPERIDHFISVLGSEGFSSGCHSWEVDVGDNAAFVLGVLTESIQRKGLIWSGLWRLMFCGGEFKALSPSDTGSDVSVMKKPKRIRVQLDMDCGHLVFSDADSNTHIHTFTHTFSDRLFPYISTWSDVPLKVAVMQVSVRVD